jgi:hypothetical protein
VGEHDRAADLVQQHGQRIRLYLLVLRCIELRVLDAQELIECFGIVGRELHARVEGRLRLPGQPGAQAPARERGLVVVEPGLVGGRGAALAGAPGPRQVGEIDRGAAAEEELLEPFAPVEGGLPGLRAAGMDHQHRQSFGCHRDLPFDIAVIAVDRAGARGFLDGPAERTAALARDRQRLGGTCRSHASGKCQKCRRAEWKNMASTHRWPP